MVHNASIRSSSAYRIATTRGAASNASERKKLDNSTDAGPSGTPDLVPEVFRRDLTSAQYRCAPELVLKFADISWPTIGLQHLAGLITDGDLTPQLLTEQRLEVLDEVRDISLAESQLLRRGRFVYYREAVVPARSLVKRRDFRGGGAGAAAVAH